MNPCAFCDGLWAASSVVEAAGWVTCFQGINPVCGYHLFSLARSSIGQRLLVGKVMGFKVEWISEYHLNQQML